MAEPVPDDIIAEICYHLDDDSLFELAKSQGLYQLVNKLLKSDYFHYRRVTNLLVASLDYNPEVKWQQVYYTVYYDSEGQSIWNTFYLPGMNHLPTLKVLEKIGNPAHVQPTMKDLEAVGNVAVMKYLIEQNYVLATSKVITYFILSTVIEGKKEDILVYLVSVGPDNYPYKLLSLSARVGFYKLIRHLLPLLKYEPRDMRGTYERLLASGNVEMLNLLLSYYPELA